jgi:hypothetical protein
MNSTLYAEYVKYATYGVLHHGVLLHHGHFLATADGVCWVCRDATATMAIGLHMSDKEVRTTSMRIGADVTELAKIAASFKGLSIMEYVSEVVRAAAMRDIDEGHRALMPKPISSKRKVKGDM